MINNQFSNQEIRGRRCIPSRVRRCPAIPKVYYVIFRGVITKSSMNHDKDLVFDDVYYTFNNIYYNKGIKDIIGTDIGISNYDKNNDITSITYNEDKCIVDGEFDGLFRIVHVINVTDNKKLKMKIRNEFRTIHDTKKKVKVMINQVKMIHMQNKMKYYTKKIKNDRNGGNDGQYIDYNVLEDNGYNDEYGNYFGTVRY